MRRIVVVATAVVALLGALSPPASAQAPAPKVTISGLIDTVTNGGKNAYDSNYAETLDSTWHARNRGVFTMTGEVGKAKGVLALEIDVGWGQMGLSDGVTSGQIGANSKANGGFGSGSTLPFTNGSIDNGFDNASGVIEVKNLYVEFPVPWIPFPTVMRLGGQPLQITMKPSVLFSTDAAAVWFSTTVAPWLKFNFTFVQVEEQFTGLRGSANNIRGDDWVIAPSIDIEPMKGVKIRPMWVWFQAQGNTATLSRCRTLCAGLPSDGSTATITPATGGVSGTTSLGNYRASSKEDRHYFAIDAQTNFGPFYFDPTVVYMDSSVDVYRTSGGTTTLNTGVTQGSGDRATQSTKTWLVDLRGGWRAGPLLLEGIFHWTPGDDAQHDSFKNSKHYHPISTDGAGWGGWGEILNSGSVDYLIGTAAEMNNNAGLGRYGLMRIGGRASYALTPDFTVTGKASTWFTDTKVDIDAVGSSTGGSFGSTPCNTPGGSASCLTNNSQGDRDYIGTEASAGFTYRFAPGLTLDAVYAHLFAGSALNTTSADVKTGTIKLREAKDVDLAAARVRYQF